MLFVLRGYTYHNASCIWPGALLEKRQIVLSELFYYIHVVLCYLNMCYKFHFVSIYLLDNGENEKIQPETFQSNSNICLVYSFSL